MVQGLARTGRTDRETCVPRQCRTDMVMGSGRRHGAVLAVTFFLAGAVSGTAVSESSTLGLASESGGSGVDQESATLYAVPTDRDRVGRILAPIMINGQGPYRFILDTGANRSALARKLVETLSVSESSFTELEVHGVTGNATLPALEIDELRAGEISLENLSVPVLGDAVFAEADGLLGVDGLQEARIEVDFDRDTVLIRRSTGRRDRGGALLVRAEMRHGGLLLVDGKVGRVPVKALIDTGAERSLGNLALYDALAEKRRRPSETVTTTVAGATPGLATGVSLLTPTVSLGEARLRNMVVTFGDLHVFEVWGLTEEPALLVGMDLIGLLQRFVVDYPRREFLLKSRGSRQPTVRRCGGTECQTRIPVD